jgi:hypothetical protein
MLSWAKPYTPIPGLRYKSRLRVTGHGLMPYCWFSLDFLFTRYPNSFDYPITRKASPVKVGLFYLFVCQLLVVSSPLCNNARFYQMTVNVKIAIRFNIV